MTLLTDLSQLGAASIGLLLPSALLLGALHGLEPGHSKTMMTAFIIAARGTVAQAVLLGLAATVSHTAVVWVVALLGLHFGSRYDATVAEPYFQLASAALILAIALWMLWRTWRRQRRVGDANPPGHDAGSGHSHAAEGAHELAHAREVRRRLAAANVTTGQIIMFGLSGGLIPCSAAIAVLVVCLQVNQLWLGIALVASFSVGLALTLTAAGAVAALGMRQVSRRWSRSGELAERAPYLSGIVMIGIGLWIGWEGWTNASAAL